MKKRIKTLEHEIKATEAKIERCQLFSYDGKDHIWGRFWTLAPRAYTRPINEVQK